jgi:hypothetical protein
MAKPSDTKALQAKDTKPKTKRRVGRPSSVTEAVQIEICARLGGGENLTQICRDPKLPNRSTITNALASGKPEFSEFVVRYARARDALLDAYADQIVMISDDGTTDYITKVGRNGHEYEAVDQEHIQRSRLRVDSRKWLLSKLRPNEYGDRIEAVASGVVSHVHDVTSLSEREKMRRFALFMAEDQTQPVDGVAVEISKPLKESTNTNGATTQADKG